MVKSTPLLSILTPWAFLNSIMTHMTRNSLLYSRCLLPPTVLHAGTAWFLSECRAHLPLQQRQHSDPPGLPKPLQHLLPSPLHHTMWSLSASVPGVHVVASFPIARTLI